MATFSSTIEKLDRFFAAAAAFFWAAVSPCTTSSERSIPKALSIRLQSPYRSLERPRNWTSLAIHIWSKLKSCKLDNSLSIRDKMSFDSKSWWKPFTASNRLASFSNVSGSQESCSLSLRICLFIGLKRGSFSFLCTWLYRFMRSFSPLISSDSSFTILPITALYCSIPLWVSTLK